MCKSKVTDGSVGQRDRDSDLISEHNIELWMFVGWGPEELVKPRNGTHHLLDFVRFPIVLYTILKPEAKSNKVVCLLYM